MVDDPKDKPARTETDAAPPKPKDGPAPADRSKPGFGGEPQGADHDTEEAAAYRENDA